MTFRQLFGTARYKKYRHGKKRKRNGGELKSIDPISEAAPQTSEMYGVAQSRWAWHRLGSAASLMAGPNFC
jgi:hypothetical protein